LLLPYHIATALSARERFPYAPPLLLGLFPVLLHLEQVQCTHVFVAANLFTFLLVLMFHIMGFLLGYHFRSTSTRCVRFAHKPPGVMIEKLAVRQQGQ